MDRNPSAPNQCVAFVADGKGPGRGCIKVEACGTSDAPNKKMFVCQIKEKPANNDVPAFVLDALNEVKK